MTKTLTEQWKDGELPDGYYYIDYDTQQRIFEIEDGCATYQGLPAETYFLNDVCLIKVIGPVPSYEEYKDLYDSNKQLMAHIKTCEQQIERLQEQLKEANEVIKTTNRMSGNIDLSQLVYEDRRKIDGITMQTESYIEKWGVK